jgi:MoaA/NifB/PqqE/SkfB family radical SAM enzyme
MTKIFPKIPIVFKDKFPKSFQNNILGWGNYSKNELFENKQKLLHLDMDFGNFCTLNCPHCFRKNHKVDLGKYKLLNYDELVNLVLDAKKLGLKSIKFIGAGEPFEDKRFLEFLRFINNQNINICVFTKGQVIGDDKLAKKYNSHYGITTGKELVKELKKLNVGILIGGNSFDNDIQDKMVGNVKGYALKRNKALKLFADAGFNKTNPTRLGLAMGPITNESYSSLFEMYKWARIRNIFPVVCPTVIAGNCSNEFWQKVTPSKDKLINLYSKIYKWNIKKEIQTLDQLKNEGISTYAGTIPCNQITCGMFVTLAGIILRCPGDEVSILGDLRKNSLEYIWKNSENYKRTTTFNCHCPPREGKSIPNGFYNEVLNNINKK